MGGYFLDIKDSQIVRREDSSDGLDLELPDAPDFVSRRRSLTLEQMLPILEERQRWFPLSPRARELRDERRVAAEFIL